LSFPAIFSEALNADAGVRLGDTPLILIWRKGLTLASPEDLTSDAVNTKPASISARET